MIRLIVASSACLLLGGCALGAALREDSVAAASRARGLAVAERVCAACHALRRDAPSPRKEARPLPLIAERFTAEGLSSELAAIAEVGHYDMPRLALAPADREDLIAYLKRR